MLLQAGANVEVSGMVWDDFIFKKTKLCVPDSHFFFQHCWTPLLLAAKENASEIVNKLLDRKPNVNATDKDGCTALTLACKEGYHDICMALLNAGAYVNLQVSLIVQNRFLFSNLNLILLSNRIEAVIPT